MNRALDILFSIFDKILHKHYVYWVAYIFPTGRGMLEVRSSYPVKSYSDIWGFTEAIKNTEPFRERRQVDIVITNYQLINVARGSLKPK